MNTIKTSLVTAFSITLGLHLLGFLVLELTGQLSIEELNDTYKNLPLSFLLFFIPIFFSYIFFKPEKRFFYNFIKPALTAAICITFYEVIHFTVFYTRPNFSVFDVVFVRVFSIGFFVSFIFTVFQTIKIHLKKRRHILVSDIRVPIKTIVFVPFIASLIYTLIILFTVSHVSNIFVFWFKFLPLGIVLAYLSVLFFKNRYYSSKIYKTVLFYILSITICCFIGILEQLLKTSLYKSLQESINWVILPGMVLFAPYFLFIVAVIHLYTLKLLQKQVEIQLKQEVSKTQQSYQQLKTQLSPHFLFNNISVLTALIEESPKKAVQFSENLSNVYRYFLEQEQQDLVLVKDEVAFAKRYLALLKDRFEDGLNYNFNIDNVTKDKFIVVIVLQQIIENVIKHNVIDNNNNIFIKLYTSANYFIVKNNKIPKNISNKTTKKGLENIIERIAFFTDNPVVIENTKRNFVVKIPILETI